MKKLVGFVVLLSSHVWAVEVTPTVRVNQSMSFADDMNFSNLDIAIDRQLKSYDTAGLEGKIRFGSKTYDRTVLKDSLVLLNQLASDARTCLAKKQPNCMSEFDRLVNEKFDFYAPVPKKTEDGYRKTLTTKFTSYYSPDLTGSRVKTARFKNPIYRLPDRPSDQGLTRVQIDYKGALSGKGYEIFYVENSFFDLYLLHVQGGGRIHIKNPDGTEEMKYLSYAGSNDRKFKMIYWYMVERGYLDPERAGVPDQRRYLEEHPEKSAEIFATCPSYIFFNESVEEPVGLDHIPLTEGRSLAMDSRIYKTTGLINFVKTQKATGLDENGQVIKAPFSRFFVAQDTGGAIRGNARCDLYAGYGPLAELIAYNMDEMGEQYFLVKK